MKAIRKTYEIPIGKKTRLKKELRNNGYSITVEPTAEVIYRNGSNGTLYLATMPKESLEVTILDLSRPSKRFESPQPDFEDASQALDEFLSSFDIS